MNWKLLLAQKKQNLAMELWSDLAFELILLKPHKSSFFQRGFQALSFIQQAF